MGFSRVIERNRTDKSGRAMHAPHTDNTADNGRVCSVTMKFLQISHVLYNTFIWILSAEVIVTTASAAAAEDGVTETALLRELFASPVNVYDRRARPQLTAVNVSISYVLEAILEVDEVSQHLSVYGWFLQTWTDRRLCWEPSRFRDLTYIVVPATNVWLPDIAFRNSVDEAYGAIFDHPNYRVIVRYNGEVTYVAAGRSTTTCLLDLTYFPYDSQACYLELDSWVYQVDQVYFYLPAKVNTTFYRPNGEWTLVDTAVVYSDQHGYATARFVIYINRKPDHIVFTLIFPCILLSLLMILVFLLPPESGEKVALNITILLSFTVFQLILRTSMPHTSDFIPIVGVYVYGVMYMAGLSMFCAVLVLFVHHGDSRSKPVPRVLRVVVHGVIARMLRMNKKSTVVPQSPSASRAYSGTSDAKATTSSERLENEAADENNSATNVSDVVWSNDRDHQQRISDDWIETARIIDRFFFVIFGVIVIVITTTLLLAIVINGPRKVEPIDSNEYL